MSSSNRPPRSRYRFGFKGKRPGQSTQETTTDEILDSLTQQAQLREKDGEELTVGLHVILEADLHEELLPSSRLEPEPRVRGLKSWDFGKLAFTIMLVGGLAFLWIYSRLSQSVGPEGLAKLQQSITRVGFTDWQKIVLMAICALIIAFLARRSTRKMPMPVISTVRASRSHLFKTSTSTNLYPTIITR